MHDYQKLLEQLQKDILYAKQTGQRTAVLCVLIHTAFDPATLASLINNIHPLPITLFQLENNTFYLLYHRVREPKNVALFARDIIQKVLHEYEINVGITLFPQGGIPHGGIEADELVKNSKIAAGMAVQIKKGSYHFFHPNNQAAIPRLIILETDIVHAITRNELFLEYQPKVFLKDKKISGVEALIRWQHPTLGLIGPGEFMHIVEKSDFIFDMGHWILETAVAEYQSWQLSNPIKLAVNLAPKQLLSYYLVDNILSIVQKYKMNPNHLEIEIVENEIIGHVADHYVKLKHLCDTGIQILVDDFGTGYSSFNYLKQLPISGLKLDKSFIDHITTNTVDQVIVKSVIDIAHTLGFHVTAEGIENEMQLEMLQHYGCDEGQGYLFSKPLSALELRKILR